MTLPPTYSVPEVAETIGKSAYWLATQARKKRVPHLKIGREVRFTEAQVQEIVAAAEVRPRSPRPRFTDSRRGQQPEPNAPGERPSPPPTKTAARPPDQGTGMRLQSRSLPMTERNPTPAEMQAQRRDIRRQYVEIENWRAVRRLGAVSIVTAPKEAEAVNRAVMLLGMRLPDLRITEGENPEVVDINPPSERPVVRPLEIIEALAKWTRAA